jgi:hypothetical protein
MSPLTLVLQAAKDPELNLAYSDFELSAARNVFRPFDHLIIHSDAEAWDATALDWAPA